MTRRLTISIREDGTIIAEASGTPGPACLDSIEPLQKILQAEVVDSKPTPDFANSAVSRLPQSTQEFVEDQS